MNKAWNISIKSIASKTSKTQATKPTINVKSQFYLIY